MTTLFPSLSVMGLPVSLSGTKRMFLSRVATSFPRSGMMMETLLESSIVHPCAGRHHSGRWMLVFMSVPERTTEA